MSRLLSVPGRLHAVALCCTALGAAGAQAADAPQTLVVTATRVPVPASQIAAEVTVIDRDAIERAQGLTLPQLLAQQPGLQLSGNGGAGKTTSVFIRGMEARHTLLLVDGMPVGSSTVGTPSLDNLPLELIDHIEIVRGPLTSLYGSGAMGGVIQLFTRRATRGLGASARVAAGTQHQGQGAAGVSYGDGRFDVVANAQRTTTSGQSATNTDVPFGLFNDDHDGFQQNSGSLKLGWQIADGWRLEGLSLGSFGRTRLDDGPGADALAALRNRVQRLALDGQLMPGWAGTLSWSESVDEYDTEASASPFASLGTVSSRTRRLQLEQRVATPIGQALALLEHSQETVDRPDQPFDVSERDIDAVSLGLTGAAAGHSWQASVRHDSNSQFAGVTTGALGWGWQFVPGWRVVASAGTSHTLPSFNQLYYPSFGNPDLQPEKGRHVEAGLEWAGAGQTVRATAFGNRYRGYITSGPQPANLPRAVINGLTVAWQAQWNALSLDASVDHTDPHNATEGSATQDKLLPRRAQNAARVAAQWQGAGWSAGADWQAFSHRYDDSANTVRLGGYGVLALDARWQIRPDLSLGLRVDNVGDKRYETALGYDQPHRSALVSLRWAMR